VVAFANPQASPDTTTEAPATAPVDPVLYQYTSWTIETGRFGPVAELQKAINAQLEACGAKPRTGILGAFNRSTRDAIIALATCLEFETALPPDSPARQGALTEALWKALAPDLAIPGPEGRSASLKLTFEATDYTVMQWNYCQNRPFFDPRMDGSKCYSNDKRSFITWGPHGATAGHGREVQAILLDFLQTGEAAMLALEQAFGAEAKAVRRMLELANNTDNSPLETYLCSVWMDPARRLAWRNGFAALGARADVRETYREVYQSASFDGGKVATFYAVWARSEFGLGVTELDHAFFLDRSAHMSISGTALAAALTALKAEAGQDWPLAPAKVRQHIAVTVRPTNQKKDRLGRDVAFYIDGVGDAGLNTEEREAWTARGARRAADIGLSDSRLMPAYTPGPKRPSIVPTGQLTASDAANCPAAVLNPLSPVPR
jgi:hypothetical protein